ncbi:MAG: universal stress protein [Burkholderiales bacterium]|nr:universal stress protein [Burkholderiales bacterium]
MKLDRILAVADQEDARQPAVRAALELLSAAPGQLQVAGFVYEHAAAEPGVLSASAAATLRRALLAAKRRWLKQCVGALLPEGTRARIEAVWTADLVDWVVEAVRREGIDLVVKAGRRSESLFHTPSDWQLLRRCPAPVLITGPKQRAKLCRILATVDAGSADPIQLGLDRKVLGAAAGLAAALGARVHAAYVVPVSTIARDLDLIDVAALQRRTRARLGAPLAALAAEYGIPAERVIIEAGPPERLLPRIAARLKADLVVMGTVGRSGARGKLLGNTAEQVLQRLHTNLLALRPD